MFLRNWILVADGSRARLIQASSDGLLHNLESFDDQRGRREPHELESDRSGQAAPGHSFEHTDPQRHAQQRFARHVAEIVNARQQDFDQLTLIAAPKTLGDLRHYLDRAVSEKVNLEINHDLTHLSLHELSVRLKSAAASR